MVMNNKWSIQLLWGQITPIAIYLTFSYNKEQDCKEALRTFTTSIIKQLIMENSIVIELLDAPTEEMQQLHNMIWKI